MEPLNALNDRELLDLLKQGDQAAFTHIYDRYQGILYIYACKIVQDDDLAEDMIQELFISLWDKRATMQIKSLSNYLYSAVRYKFFDLIDKRKVREDYVQAFQVFLQEGHYSTDNYIAEKELARIVEKEIANLPPRMREIFLLSEKANLSNEEIAERLGITEKTVKNQVNLAMQTLRVKLGLFAYLFLLVHHP